MALEKINIESEWDFFSLALNQNIQNHNLTACYFLNRTLCRDIKYTISIKDSF